MARVTTEDCTPVIPNRFQLVILAAQRTRSIANGAPIMVERDNDKDPVIALREIAEREVDPEAIREDAITAGQRYVQQVETEFDDQFSLEDRHIKSWTIVNAE